MKRLLVLSDIHCGSKLAISPLSFPFTDGGMYHANHVQRALFEAWREVVKDWKNPDVLVINGEPIDGQGRFDSGVEQWSTNYMDQIDASVQLVKMFNAKKIYVTRGSNYHVMLGGVSIEEVFAERVGASKNNLGDLVSMELFLTVNKTSFNFAHHIPGSRSGWMYRSTPPAKEMMLMQLNQSHKWPADVIVRSHNHYYWYVGGASKMSLLTPGWKVQDWFGYRMTAAGSIPDIGAVQFTVTEDAYDWDAKLFKLQETRPPKVTA